MDIRSYVEWMQREVDCTPPEERYSEAVALIKGMAKEFPMATYIPPKEGLIFDESFLVGKDWKVSFWFEEETNDVEFYMDGDI